MTKVDEQAQVKVERVELDPREVFEARMKDKLAWKAMRERFNVKHNSTRFYAVMAPYAARSKAKDVREAVDTVGGLITSLVAALRGASALTLVIAVLVLGGALAAGHRHRVYDAVVLKTVGATRPRLLAAYALEYLMLGVATAVFGAFGTVAGLVMAFGATGGEAVDPSQKARILAQGISAAINCTAAALLVWLPSAIALAVLTRSRKSGNDPRRRG